LILFGNPDKCTEASSNIMSEADDSVSFELFKRAAEEKHARTSEQIDLIAQGNHRWQQPEFIKAHCKCISSSTSSPAWDIHIFEWVCLHACLRH